MVVGVRVRHRDIVACQAALGADRRTTVAAVDPATHLEHLRTDIERIRAVAGSALDATVDACPGWTVADLLTHHAGVFAFATAQLRAEPGSELASYDPPPDDVPPLEVFSAAADALVAELVAVDPDEHRPNWAGAPTAAFWFRRMAQESAIHRWDVQHAAGGAEPIEVALAIDGIDELADRFLPFAGRRGITGSGETVHLHATDEGVQGEWTLTFTESGVEVERAHGKGDMAARGPASDLLLFVWNRRPVAIETFGEPDLLEWWSSRVRI